MDLKLELKYLKDMKTASELNRTAGYLVYCSFNNDRQDTHELLCDKYGIDYIECKMKITNRLDETIGFDLDYDYNEEEMFEFAKKLSVKLNEMKEVRDE